MRTSKLSCAVVVMGSLATTTARADDADLRSTADVALWSAAGFQLGHQLDHFGRKDFSAPAIGLPILFVGSTLGGRYLLDGGPLYFTIVDSFWLVGYGITHFSGVVETPDTVYAKWTETDQTIARSASAGRLAQAVIVGAVVSLGAHLGLTLLDGRKHGFTWRRHVEPASRLTVIPEDGGASVAWTARF